CSLRNCTTRSLAGRGHRAVEIHLPKLPSAALPANQRKGVEIIMSKYRKVLPQLGSRLFLTDGGLETTLIFHHGLDLPQFASFALLCTSEGRKMLRDYFLPYIETARQARMGF